MNDRGDELMRLLKQTIPRLSAVYQRRTRSPQRRRQFPGEPRSLGQYFMEFLMVFGPFLDAFSKADEPGFPIFKNPK